MQSFSIDILIETASEVYGVDATSIHRGKAEYLSRLINKGGDIIPPVIILRCCTNNLK